MYHCNDGIKNKDETDVNCGGADCVGCAGGQACLQDSDCLSEQCHFDNGGGNLIHRRLAGGVGRPDCHCGPHREATLLCHPIMKAWVLALGDEPAFGERKVSSATDVRASNLYIPARARPCVGNAFRRAACRERAIVRIYKGATVTTRRRAGEGKDSRAGVDCELGASAAT